MRARVIVLAAATTAWSVVGCSKQSAAPARGPGPAHQPEPARSPPSCERTIRAMATYSLAPVSEAQIADGIAGCEDQHWNAAFRTCLTESRSREAAKACIAAITPAEGTRKSEAEIELELIQQAADAAYAEHGSFPIGTVGLTPAAGCCVGPHQRCERNPADWAVPAWRTLGFEMTDRHFYFQYSYGSDGKTYTAEAVGDLDCDEVTSTFTMRGAIEHGRPTHELTKPARVD